MENMHQLNVFLAELHATLETQREHGDMRVPPVVVLISRLPAVVAASGSSLGTPKAVPLRDPFRSGPLR